MEEAYSQLYQEFLCLRSLCLRQAALLRQLTAALQRQQVANGELSDMAPIAVQCIPEISFYLKETSQPPSKPTSEVQCGVQCPYKNMGTFSDILAEDMSKLCMETPADRKETKPVHCVPPLFNLDSRMSHGASHNVVKHPKHMGHLGKDGKIPLAGCQSHCGDLLTQSSSGMLSDVTLQSHICDFCQAVFPGETTTRGEYLRHLYTHIT